jgi:hypothetical protein
MSVSLCLVQLSVAMCVLQTIENSGDTGSQVTNESANGRFAPNSKF